jgi:ribosomal protein L11 methyltransferase
MPGLTRHPGSEDTSTELFSCLRLDLYLYTVFSILMKNDSENIPSDLAVVRGEALQVVTESTARVTPPALEKTLIERHGLTKTAIKAVIRDLVSDGELAYTYEFGTTFLELSFNKPVRVSTHVVMKPPGHHFQPQSRDVVIQIKPGAAFGDGRHPTSRLAVRGIEAVLQGFNPDMTADSRVLDIGTGSGILVLTAVRLGVHRGVGIDIDPAARSEARENVSLNRLAEQIEISDQALETIAGSFNLVTANLRYPSLKKIGLYLKKIFHPQGFLVCSGIRSHELPGLIGAYARINFEVLWQDETHDWAGVVFKRNE